MCSSAQALEYPKNFNSVSIYAEDGSDLNNKGIDVYHSNNEGLARFSGGMSFNSVIT